MQQNIYHVLKERDFIDQISSEELVKRFEKPISFYIGFDPTSDSLHLGNLVGIIAAKWLLDYGHYPYALVGGATGRIGDPSGKSIERPLLEDERIEENVKQIERQLKFILQREKKGNVAVINNNDWLKTITIVDFLRDIGKHFRLGAMLGKESVRARLNSEEGMSFTEFSYQILQAYDFYHLSVKNKIELQLGGSDQWGNITAGIELSRRLNGPSLYGMTFPLLTRSDGKKFGKSEGGAIWLSSEKLSPYEFYQYLFKTPDADVIRLLKMLTFLDIKEINKVEKQMKQDGYESNRAQKLLASEVTRFVHEERGLEKALKATSAAAFGSETTLSAARLKEMAGDLPTITLSRSEVIGKKYVEIATLSGLVPSKSEAIRLVKNKGAYLNNEKVEDEKYVVTDKDLIGNLYLLLGKGKASKLLVELL